MKNKITFLAAILLLMTIGFGCNMLDKGNGSTSDNSSSNPNDTAKTGVAECDEFLDLLNNDLKKSDEDFVTRKFREYLIDFAKESVKKNIEENKGDKTKIAEGCKKAKDDYIKKRDEKNKDEKKDNSQKL